MQLLTFFKKEEKTRWFKLDIGNMHANFLHPIELIVRAIFLKNIIHILKFASRPLKFLAAHSKLETLATLSTSDRMLFFFKKKLKTGSLFIKYSL
jgi:hypothetical protein